jgi:phospholipid/cholesterol/gamma-HCH transport system ATP-binding protein
MQAQDAAIEITGLGMRFGGLVALADIDLKIAKGRKTVIVGPAASGKTVLMKCISGIFRPTTGQVTIDGRQVERAGSRAHSQVMEDVGVLFQQGGLFDGLPVWENVSFKLRQNLGMSDTDARARAIELLAQVNLPAETADLFPAELSGGMQKRGGIARAMAGKPSLLLLDEPTAGLDPITTNTINALIDKSIRGTGATVLAITSDMRAAREAYDDLIMLDEGRVVWSGSTAGIDQSGNAYILQMMNGGDGPIKVRVEA